MKKMSNETKKVISFVGGNVATYATAYVGGFTTTMAAAAAASIGCGKSALAILVVGDLITMKKSIEMGVFVYNLMTDLMIEPEFDEKPEEKKEEVC